MDPHFRKIIRDRLIEILTDLPGQADGPLDSLADVLEQNRAPRTCVRFSEEPIGTRTKSAIERELGASLIVVAKRHDDLEVIAAEIERRMVPEPLVDVRAELQSTDFLDKKRGEFDFFGLSLNYLITYSTEEGSPDRLAC